VRWARLSVAAALVVVGQVVTFFLLRSQGNDLGGDQANYLIAAQALAHGSLHLGPWYQRDFLAHYVYNWPAGATTSNFQIVQTYPGPHGSVFSHGLGLPLLLAPFVAVGNVPLGLLGLFGVIALGVVCIHQRGSRLARLGRSGRIVFALALAAPALWVASTQVYPDLVSGVLLGAALVEVGLVERERVMSPFGAIVVTGVLVVEPWLQIKNLLPALCVAVAATVVIVRLGGSRRSLVVMAAVVLASWALLLGYNLFFFGHPEGLPQPHPTITGTSLTRVLALALDRDQGLLVQVPTVLLGVLGLWAARRTVPWAAGAAAAGSVLIILVNGTYTSEVPFGGAALAGRFEWTVAPMLLAWAPCLLVAIARHRARIVGVGVAIGLLWVAQAVPLLEGSHQYLNAMIAPFAPWDPTLYPGWWPGLGGALPTFLAPGLHDAATWSHLLVELLLAGAVTFVLQMLARPGPLRAGPIATVVGALCALALVVAVVAPPRDEPQSSLTWPGSVIGSPWSTDAQGTVFAPVVLADGGPGSFRAVLTYAGVAGSAPATASLVSVPYARSVISGWFTPRHPTDASLLSVTPPPLELSAAQVARTKLRPKPVVAASTTNPASGNARSVSPTRTTQWSITTNRTSVIALRVTLPPHSSYAATTLTLTKLSSG
jgi:hypothetical protein